MDAKELCEYYLEGACTKEGFSPNPWDVGTTVYGECDGCNGTILLGSNSDGSVRDRNLYEALDLD